MEEGVRGVIACGSSSGSIPPSVINPFFAGSPFAGNYNSILRLRSPEFFLSETFFGIFYISQFSVELFVVTFGINYLFRREQSEKYKTWSEVEKNSYKTTL